MIRRLMLAGVLAVGATVTAQASPLFEGFDDVAGLGAAGWVQANASVPLGESGWFQGNTGVFAGQAGSAESYIGANYLNAAFGGNVDNWLISPLLSLGTGDIISFFTRTNGAFPGDSLDLLVSNGSTNLADFSSVLSIGGAYPSDWSMFTYTYSGAAADLRLAFRYHVTDTSLNGDYIGIDSVTVTPVAEPGTLALFGIGLLALVPIAARRRRAKTVSFASAVALAAIASAAASAGEAKPAPAVPAKANITDPATLPKFDHVVVVNMAMARQASAKTRATQPPQASGMRAYIDPETKQLRQPTAEELAQEAAASQSARRLSKSAVASDAEMSPAVRRPNGTVSVALGEEFMSYEVAHVAADGSVKRECVGTQPNAKSALKAPAAHEEHSHEK